MINKSRKFNISYKASLVSPNNKNDVRVWIAEPMNSVYQKIDNFSISPKPVSYYKDDKGNKILYFQFKDIENINILMNIKITLHKNFIDLNKKKVSIPQKSSKLSRQHTKGEKFLEQTPQIKKTTDQLIRNNKTILDKMQSIFDFITKNFKYCYPIKQRGVKYLILNNLKGDCGEYSSLFVTMCRILKIPARNNTGFAIFPEKKNITEHGWANIYLKPYGWIDVDTQYASLEKSIKLGIKKYFGQRSDYRINFVNGFNIPLKPKIPKNFQLSYWNNLGLPLTNNSVQTLQPIVFASKKKVKFKDNIELI